MCVGTLFSLSLSNPVRLFGNAPACLFQVCVNAVFLKSCINVCENASTHLAHMRVWKLSFHIYSCANVCGNALAQLVQMCVGTLSLFHLVHMCVCVCVNASACHVIMCLVTLLSCLLSGNAPAYLFVCRKPFFLSHTPVFQMCVGTLRVNDCPPLSHNRQCLSLS